MSTPVIQDINSCRDAFSYLCACVVTSTLTVLPMHSDVLFTCCFLRIYTHMYLHMYLHICIDKFVCMVLIQMCKACMLISPCWFKPYLICYELIGNADRRCRPVQQAQHQWTAGGFWVRHVGRCIICQAIMLDCWWGSPCSTNVGVEALAFTRRSWLKLLRWIDGWSEFSPSHWWVIGGLKPWPWPGNTIPAIGFSWLIVREWWYWINKVVGHHSKEW